MTLVSITKAVKIKNQRVKPFNGERDYMATGGLVGTEIKTEKVTYKTKPSRADLLVSKNQLIVARMKETNKVLLIDENNCDLIVSTGFLVLDVQIGWHPGFLYHFFVSKFFQDQKDKLSIGATQKAINNEKFKEIIIPELSFEDQERIAKILDEADALRQKRKQVIGLLDHYLKSVFWEMFGDPVKNEKKWTKKTGEEYCEKLTVGVVIKPASHYVEKGVIALRSLNIRPNKITLNDLVYFSSESHKKLLSKSRLNEGDVVFVRTGATGTAAIIPKSLDGCNCIDLIITRPKKDLMHPIYLCYFFNSDFGKRLVLSKNVGGIQQHFNIGALKKMEIPCPPFLLQEEFAVLVEKVELLKEVMLTQFKELEIQFQALIQKAFKGKL